MASIIKVDRILDSTELGKVDIPGGIETDVLNAAELIADTWKDVDGTENYKCKCWVNFDGTTTPPTIRASGNVSSVVRNGVGRYVVNFQTSMVDTNYCCVMNGSATLAGDDSASSTTIAAVSKTLGGFEVDSEAGNATPSQVDTSIAEVAVFR